MLIPRSYIDRVAVTAFVLAGVILALGLAGLIGPGPTAASG